MKNFDNNEKHMEEGHPNFKQAKSIRIPFSEEDLDRLQNNETFDWCFDGVEVHLYKGDELE